MEINVYFENVGDSEVGILGFNGKLSLEINDADFEEDFLKSIEHDMTEFIKERFELETRCNTYDEVEYTILTEGI
jgi:hypothetical protein